MDEKPELKIHGIYRHYKGNLYLVEGFATDSETLEPMIISEDTNIYWILAGNLKIGDIVYQVPVSEKLDEGVYSGTIVTERLSPMSLLLN